MESQDWIYAWEESFVDEDGRLCVVTMLSHAKAVGEPQALWSWSGAGVSGVWWGF